MSQGSEWHIKQYYGDEIIKIQTRKPYNFSRKNKKRGRGNLKEKRNLTD
jgi:hypothetical protein